MYLGIYSVIVFGKTAQSDNTLTGACRKMQV